MKFSFTRFQDRKFRDEAGDEGEKGGGSGGEEGAKGAGETVSASEFAALKAKLEETASENERLSHKINEANKHKKEAERIAKEEARKKAESEGNHEQLYKSAMEENEILRSQLTERDKRDARNAERSEARKLATAIGTVSDGANEDLTNHIAKRLKYTEEGIKVTDESGNLTVSTLDSLKDEIANSARYAHLIKGNQSSGGGASGGGEGSGTTKTISRAQFDAMGQNERATFLKNKGKVVD